MNKTLINLLDLEKSEIEAMMTSFGKKAFHGRQLHSWIYRKGVFDLDHMTDLSKSLRADLKEAISIDIPEIEEIASGESEDSATKFLFRLRDGNLVETVLIPSEARMTLCLSCQVGCAWKCTFCATGKLGLSRNMTAAEIVGTYLVAREYNNPTPISNVVFMGMGEPLANLNAVITSWRRLTDPDGIGLSKRKVTISTVGIPQKVRELAEVEYPPKLVFSIGSPDEEIRREMLLVAGKHSLDEMYKALRYYTEHTRNRITIALLVADGLNDTPAAAKQLHRWIHNLPAKVNLLRYNDAGGSLRPPEERKIEAVAAELVRLGRTVVLRSSRGRDIAAACGQLAGKRVHC